MKHNALRITMLMHYLLLSYFQTIVKQLGEALEQVNLMWHKMGVNCENIEQWHTLLYYHVSVGIQLYI